MTGHRHREAAHRARVAEGVDFTAASATAAAFRELQEQHVIGFSAAEEVRRALRESLAFQPTRIILAGIQKQTSAAATMQESLRRINDANAAQVREIAATIDVGAKWRQQLRETIEALTASTAITEQMCAAIVQGRTIAARLTVTPGIRAALAEAEVASAVDEGMFAKLTEAQKAVSGGLAWRNVSDRIERGVLRQLAPTRRRCAPSRDARSGGHVV